MNNILTPEEANKPVTYGDLMTILESMTENITQGESDMILKIADKLTDYMVRIRDDAEYKRQRDIHFLINYLSQQHLYQSGHLFDIYQNWCDEFDKLNKPQNESEDANG